MRYFIFSIFLIILLISGVGLIFFFQQLFNAYEDVIASELQAKLLELKLSEVEYSALILEKKQTTLLFCGDVMLSRSVAGQIEKNQDYRYPFLKIAEFTEKADLFFGNLEGPISSRGQNQGSIYSFRANPKVIEGLKFAGFDVLSLANNHIWDWGSEALEDTIDILKNNDIEPVGVGKNYSEANNPVIKEINKIKIAFFAYTNLYPESFKADVNSSGISDFNLQKIKDKIKSLKLSQTADIVVISLHQGEEYEKQANESQKKTARELIDAGADLIVGHHPHVVQEIEEYKKGWIAYSLGNFVFDQSFSQETMEGLILKVVIENKIIFEVSAIKTKINSAFQPEIIEL
ncbi:CapA family protein [Candidatus Wolfebacteria bacterium]|nr:CapA family protein [Candidatus Wolfebacteria bacterium]